VSSKRGLQLAGPNATFERGYDIGGWPPGLNACGNRSHSNSMTALPIKWVNTGILRPCRPKLVWARRKLLGRRGARLDLCRHDPRTIRQARRSNDAWRGHRACGLHYWFGSSLTLLAAFRHVRPPRAASGRLVEADRSGQKQLASAMG